MQNTSQLTYYQARQLYQDISNYPVAIARFQEYGLSEEKAKLLADQISQELSDYELASDTYSRELWTGIILTLVGIISVCLVLTYGNDDRVRYFRILRLSLFAGIWQLRKAIRKRKIITRFEKQGDFPVIL